MTWVEWLQLCAALCFLSYEVGAYRQRRKDETMGSEKLPMLHWQSLPSGWSKSNGQMVGYAICDNGRYYWWIRRGEKTIIEGPATTLELAQFEVEAAMHDLTRGI